MQSFHHASDWQPPFLFFFSETHPFPFFYILHIIIKQVAYVHRLCIRTCHSDELALQVPILLALKTSSKKNQKSKLNLWMIF
jgi:hypothetical protein